MRRKHEIVIIEVQVVPGGPVYDLPLPRRQYEHICETARRRHLTFSEAFAYLIVLGLQVAMSVGN